MIYMLLWNCWCKEPIKNGRFKVDWLKLFQSIDGARIFFETRYLSLKHTQYFFPTLWISSGQEILMTNLPKSYQARDVWCGKDYVTSKDWSSWTLRIVKKDLHNVHVWVPCSIHPSKDSRYSIYLFGNQTMFCHVCLTCFTKEVVYDNEVAWLEFVFGTALEEKRKRSVSNYETCEKPKKIPDSSYLHINFHRCRCRSRLFMSFYSSSSLLEWRENVTGLQSTVVLL